MGLVFGKDRKEILMSENGKWGVLKAMVFIFGLMVIVMKDNLRIVLRKGMELRNLQMEIHISEIIVGVNHLDRVNIIGIMEQYIRGNL